MSAGPGISRRRFFELAGGGVIVFLGIGPLPALSQDAERIYPQDFNAYLVIGQNGEVTVFSGKIEMGQGVLTSQAQMVAEELGVPLASIRLVLGDTARCPVDRGTFGSLTTRMFGPVLRAAAARARAALMTLAATKLGVAPQDLTVTDGVVSVIGQPNRSVSYAELSKGARIAQAVDGNAILRNPSDFQVMGTSPKRLDGIEKVTGAAQYAADVRLPGMLYARILRPPRHGAALSRVDTAGAAKLPGITLVHHGDLVAVLHADPQVAEAALAHLKADWTTPESKLDPDSIYEHIESQAAAPKTLLDRGDVAAARARAGQLFEARYQKGYVAHAAMEPHAALAQVAAGKATVWASTQTPFPTRDRIAQRLGLLTEDVRVITPYLGGGFGGKSADGQAIEAAVLAQVTGKPVQVAWSRAEEFFYDTFDPACVVKIASKIDADARISLWDSMVYSAGDRGAVFCYDMPVARVQSTGALSYGTAPAGLPANVHPFAVGPWRAPGANMNVFAIESQIDLMAAAAGLDPLAFRLRNLTDARMRRVLQAAADAFGWRAAVAPSKRGFGMACNIDAGTYVATMAEVTVNPADGHVQVMRVVCAQDMGVVVNPDGARMQIEGGITMGLGYALAEELRFRGGDILDRNFDTYEIPRFSWVPKIDIVLVKNDELAPQGGGEPPITTTGAVLANAIFDATGARLYRLPMTAERVRRAISAKDAIIGDSSQPVRG
jgi:nicotinate dehydrogenase subunit B